MRKIDAGSGGPAEAQDRQPPIAAQEADDKPRGTNFARLSVFLGDLEFTGCPAAEGPVRSVEVGKVPTEPKAA